MDNNSKGIIGCLLAAVIWGIAFPVMSEVLVHIDAFAMTLIRYGTALLCFIPCLIIREGKSALSLKDCNNKLLAFFGVCGFAGFGFFMALGQKMAGKSGALNASVINATMPILGILLNCVLKHSPRPSLLSLICILCSFLGVTLVITKGDIIHIFHNPDDFTADLLMLLGALCWVAYTMGVKYFSGLSSLRYTTFTMIYGMIGITFFEIILLFSGIAIMPTYQDLAAIIPQLIYIGFISSFVGVLSWNIGNKILTPINGVLFINAVPIASFIYSQFQGILPTTIQVLGLFITVSALITNNLLQRNKI